VAQYLTEIWVSLPLKSTGSYMDASILRDWTTPAYQRVKRNSEENLQTHLFFACKIKALVADYTQSANDRAVYPQKLRLIRDSIDFCLRRAHGYLIDGGFKKNGIPKGGFYFEHTTTKHGWIFEHLIPLSDLRDQLIMGALEIDEAIYPPMVVLSKESNQRLRPREFSAHNPEPLFPFRRYVNAGIASDFFRFDEVAPDLTRLERLASYRLDDHYNFVRGLGILSSNS